MAIFGDTLRQARAHRGVTLKEAEQATRINRHHLAALEDENFGALPPLIYQRGIVRNYAVYLDLDPAKLLAMFEEAHGAVVIPTEVIQPLRPLDMPSHWAPNFAIIAFAVVMSAILFAWVYSAYFAQGEAAPTATQPMATVTAVDPDSISLPTIPPAVSPEASPVAASPAASLEPTVTPEPSPTPAPSPTPTDEPEPTLDVPSFDEIISSADEPEPAVEEEPEPAAEEEEAEPAQTDGPVTSIAVTADQVDLYLEVTVDGELAFAGTLPAGESTDPFVGNTFSFYTTSGANTFFTNACGDTYQLGYDDGEAVYGAEYGPGSCPA